MALNIWKKSAQEVSNLRLKKNPDQLHYEIFMAELIKYSSEQNKETANEELLMYLVS